MIRLSKLPYIYHLWNNQLFFHNFHHSPHLYLMRGSSSPIINLPIFTGHLWLSRLTRDIFDIEMHITTSTFLHSISLTFPSWLLLGYNLTTCYAGKENICRMQTWIFKILFLGYDMGRGKRFIALIAHKPT